MKKEIKVAYFPSTAIKSKVLTSNGRALDNCCIKCETTENLETGNYILDSTFLLEAQEYLDKENILKVKMDYGDEIFRISKVDVGTRYITIVARQITISESLTLYLADVRPTNQGGQGAVGWLLANAIGTKEIIIQSNISTIATAYYEDKSLHEALYNSDNSFIAKWGGETQRRAYTLTINQSIGMDRGVTIREGKNLTGFTGTTNIDSLVTRARGKGFNGLKGNWINSPLINSYARVYIKTIEFADVKVKGDSDTEGFATEALAIAELDRLIALEYRENDIDKMKATFDVNFVQLEKTEEYKNYVQAEKIYLGDTIRVYIPKIDTDIKVRAIERVYDVLAQKTKDLKLSNVVVAKNISTSNIIADLKKQYQDTNNDSIAQYIDAIIKSGMKGSYILVRENEVLAMDTKDINTAMTVTRVNKNGIGFSTTGYYGKYTYGFTLDGVINASLIGTGAIVSHDGKVRLDISGDSGVNITGGALTVKNNDGLVTIDGSKKVMGIAVEGFVTINCAVGELESDAYITHNYGYKPVFLGYQQSGADEFNAGVLPTMAVSSVSTGVLGFDRLIRMSASTTRFLFRVNRSQANADEGAQTVTIKYIVFNQIAF